MFDSSAKKAEASAKTDDEDSSDDEEEDAIGEKGKAPNALLMEVCTHLKIFGCLVLVSFEALGNLMFPKMV